MADKLAIKLGKWAQDNQERLGIDTDKHGCLNVCTECLLFIEEDTPEAAADLYIHTREGKAHIFVEVERSSNTSVVHNIAKYWPWDERGLDSHKRDKIHLIQVLNPWLFRGRNYKSSVEVAKFVAKKIEQERGSHFQYELIDNLKPRKDWDTEAFAACKKKIEAVCLRKGNGRLRGTRH